MQRIPSDDWSLPVLLVILGGVLLGYILYFIGASLAGLL